MGSQYASGTSVAPEKSRAEIERTLARFGATAFAYMTTPERAAIMFEFRQRRIRMALDLPQERDFAYTPTRQRRTATAMRTAHEQAIRQRWRALALLVKAKLEAVTSEITTFEQEFLSATLLPSGATVGEWMEPQLDDVYASGRMPPMLPGVSAPADVLALPEGRYREDDERR